MITKPLTAKKPSTVLFAALLIGSLVLLLSAPLAAQDVRLNTLGYDIDKKEAERLMEVDRQYEREVMTRSDWDENAWVYFTLDRAEQEIEVSGGKIPAVAIKAAAGEVEANPGKISADDKKLKLVFRVSEGKKARKVKTRCDLPDAGAHEVAVFRMPGSQEYRCLSRELDPSAT